MHALTSMYVVQPGAKKRKIREVIVERTCYIMGTAGR